MGYGWTSSCDCGWTEKFYFGIGHLYPTSLSSSYFHIFEGLYGEEIKQALMPYLEYSPKEYIRQSKLINQGKRDIDSFTKHQFGNHPLLGCGLLLTKQDRGAPDASRWKSWKKRIKQIFTKKVADDPSACLSYQMEVFLCENCHSLASDKLFTLKTINQEIVFTKIKCQCGGNKNHVPVENLDHIKCPKCGIDPSEGIDIDIGITTIPEFHWD